MMFKPASVHCFRYVGFYVDGEAGELTCQYALDDDWHFVERITVGSGRDWSTPAAVEAARLVFLLAGVSYYKTAAPPVIDLCGTQVRPGELAFLRSYYLDGLGEFAFRNGLDLSNLTFVGGSQPAPPAPFSPVGGRPLIPFGGGIDSIVTVEALRDRFPDAALFVASRRADRYTAIEHAAAATQLPVARAERELDPRVLRSAENGFLNGHVPVTGILSALAVLVAVLEDRDAVVMSNEWSASIGNLEVNGRSVNHQFSKSWEFETGLRSVLSAAFLHPPQYFSFLRPFSELWVAQRFAGLQRYHHVFRSCNRAFHIDPRQRAATWCGTCDKCCFIDLVLAPFMPADTLSSVFGGLEPLRNPETLSTFRTLIGTASGQAKPFECVGDVRECQVAAVWAAARADRAQDVLLRRLVADLGGDRQVVETLGDQMLAPLGAGFTPDAYAAADLLV